MSQEKTNMEILRELTPRLPELDDAKIDEIVSSEEFKNEILSKVKTL